MKNNFTIKQNNKGASLVMVIIGLAFIATLGTIVIGAAIRNIKMKELDKKTKESFYSAEAALDEIKAGLIECVANQTSKAYEEVLTNYSSTNKAMRNEIFNNTFIEGIRLELKVSAIDNTISPILLTDYLHETKKDNITGNGAIIASIPSFNIEEDKSSLVINGLKVTNYKNGYATSITTDIRIQVPSVTFKDPVVNNINIPFEEYSIIAGDSLLASLTSHSITGNVYAGTGGITVSNEKNQVVINASQVITAGDIIVKDKASLVIQGPNTEVWATNLVTTQTDKKENYNLDTTLQIAGTSYVKDDLVLDAKKSKVILTGEYYGYSNGWKASDNSAIMINASNAALKLDGLTKLYLAGRAFLSMTNEQVPYDTAPSYGVTSNSNSDIMTGESLAIKGSQSLYLLPGEYVAVGHNPVSWNEYTAYYNSSEELINIPEDAIIFDDTLLPEEERKLYYYLDEITPIKKAFYKFGTDLNVVYYYLNFKSQNLATTYAKNYVRCYPNQLYNGFPISEITMNDSIGSIISAGNLYSYDGSIDITTGNNGVYVNNYSNQYFNLNRTLQKEVYGSGTVFDSIINSSNIIADASGNAGVAYHQNGTYYIQVVDNKTYNTPFVYNQGRRTGIIIATGDVEIRSDFEGLVIAGGTITLYNQAKIDGNPTMIHTILTSNNQVRRYINGLEMDDNESNTGLQSISITDLIGYENWKKN